MMMMMMPLALRERTDRTRRQLGAVVRRGAAPSDSPNCRRLSCALCTKRSSHAPASCIRRDGNNTQTETHSTIHNWPTTEHKQTNNNAIFVRGTTSSLERPHCSSASLSSAARRANHDSSATRRRKRISIFGRFACVVGRLVGRGCLRLLRSC